MPLSDIYFSYKNYINNDYSANWDFIKSLMKKYDINARRGRVTIQDVTEDIGESNVLIKKGYYALSFNNSKVSLVDQIMGFNFYHTVHHCCICFYDGNRRLYTERGHGQNDDVRVIVEKKEDIARIDKYSRGTDI